MTIPSVSSTGTNQVWIGRTNQAIGVINALTDGALTLNGSITFSNSTFSLILPSLNVNNSIVVTGTGNTVFLNSSNAVINGTVYVTGSGNSLYVSHDALITGNLSVNTSATFGGTLFANNEIVGNANVQVAGIDGQLRAVQGNHGVIFRNDGNSFYILQTGSVSNATSATFNSMQPFIWNLSTGILTLDASNNGTIISGNLTINGANTSLNVSNNVLVQGNLTVSGPQVVVTNNANVQGQLTTTGLMYANGGIQMSNAAITFDKPGSTYIQYSQSDFGGNGALQLAGNIQVNGQMVVTGTATFTNTVTFQSTTDASLNVGGSAFVGSNLTVTNLITAGNGVFSDLHGQGRIISEGEIVAKLGTGGNFRAIQGSYGAITRNDGVNFYLLTTGSVSNPDTATYNSIRPFAFNLASGSVAIDQTSNGTSIGGITTIGSITPTSGLTLDPVGSIILPNGGVLYGKDSGGTPRPLMASEIATNTTDIYAGINGTFRVLNATGSTQFASITTSGMSISGSMTLGAGLAAGAAISIPNNAYYYGKDTGGTARPVLGVDSLNNTTAWCGLSGKFRVINHTGTTEIFSITDNGVTILNGPVFNILGGALCVGGAQVNNQTGAIEAYYGFSVKAGVSTSSFRANFFNIDWSGTGSGLYIDNELVASFAFGASVSDRRLKTKIKTAPQNALAKIKQLRSVTYRLKNSELCKNMEEVKQLGYIADELQQIIPEAVTGEKDALREDGSINPQGLNPIAIIATATQAISELADKYDALERRINLLEQKLNTV